MKTSETATSSRWALTRSRLNRIWGTLHGERREQGQLSSGCFSRLGRETVGDLGQGLDALAFAVLDHEFESAGLAQAADRRRLEHDGDRAADFLGDRRLKLRRQAPAREARVWCARTIP